MYPNISIKYKIIQIILFKRLSINYFNKKMIFFINLNIKVIYFYQKIIKNSNRILNSYLNHFIKYFVKTCKQMLIYLLKNYKYLYKMIKIVIFVMYYQRKF